MDPSSPAKTPVPDHDPGHAWEEFVVASVYRKQAASEADPAARRALLDRAMSTYNQLLTDETLTARAKLELESTRSELQALPR